MLVNINGEITAADKASIPVLDHGFLFGDSVYETCRTYHRKLFLFSRHFARLEHSANGIFLKIPWTEERVHSEIVRTIEAAGHTGESKIRLIVTRGVGDLIADADTCRVPNVIIIVAPLQECPRSLYTDGVEMTIISSVRRGGMVGDYKTGNLIHQVLATHEAKLRGAYDAILLSTEGYISDGIACNVYMVKGNTLMTPGPQASIVEGITKGVVLSIARDIGMNVVQGLFLPKEIADCSEMFLTGTVREVVPVVRVDGNVIANGKPGPWTMKIHEAYRSAVERLLAED